jgi:pyruvate/2-oxoglutarate dehydrogenase complex dihydrolipoamide acyltransferase (E2) component
MAERKPRTRAEAGLVDDDYEPPLREDVELSQQSEDDEDAEPQEEYVAHAPSSVFNPQMSEEEQGMEMKPVVFGPPAYGSPDPATSSVTLAPLEQYPESLEISEDYAQEPEATEEGASGDDVNATSGAVDLAESEGVDLTQVEGTGDGGRITKADVENYLAEQNQTA